MFAIWLFRRLLFVLNGTVSLALSLSWSYSGVCMGSSALLSTELGLLDTNKSWAASRIGLSVVADAVLFQLGVIGGIIGDVGRPSGSIPLAGAGPCCVSWGCDSWGRDSWGCDSWCCGFLAGLFWPAVSFFLQYVDGVEAWLSCPSLKANLTAHSDQNWSWFPWNSSWSKASLWMSIPGPR